LKAAFGEHYFDTGNNSAALDYATQALQSDPQNIAANVLMGNIQLSLYNIEEAEYHAKFIILQNPENKAALTLFANIKMRQNIVFGLWWRFNSALANLSHLKSAIMLIGAYLFFNLLSQITDDLGYSQASIVISYSWLAFVVYTWVGIPYYQRKLAKELEKFSFNSKF
jgi:tetratricopeptide (TPR) repeat protein